MSVRISVNCAQSLIALCEIHYTELINNGCIEDVAADRTYDALTCALEKTEMHCFDTRDRLLENKLRTIAQKGKAA